MRKIVYFDHFGDEFEDGDQLWGHNHHSDPESVIWANKILDMIIVENICALTPKQILVIGMLRDGYSYRGIGEYLGVSQQAARRHFGRARLKILRHFVNHPKLAGSCGLFGTK